MNFKQGKVVSYGFRVAAQLRAATGVKTPDSLQLVAALAASSTAFLTNDRGLPDIPGIRVLQLHSYVESGAAVPTLRE